jgi:outer membrane protein OmpA-like peptidoglycan-associated protein
MYEDLNKVVNFLLDNPEFKVKISGHTDSAGDPGFNLLLSQKRADAIEGYIVLNGVEEYHVESKGYGSTRPIVVESTEKDRKLNRRVEFEIYKPDPKK